MIVQKFKIGEPYYIVLNSGVEIVAKVVNISSGGDLIVNCCKRIDNSTFNHYPLFSKCNSNITVKGSAISLICELDPDIASVYEQYIASY